MIKGIIELSQEIINYFYNVTAKLNTVASYIMEILTYTFILFTCFILDMFYT